MKNKKIGSALLALAGMSLVLTGCGGGTNTAVTNPDGSEQETSKIVSVIQINATEKVVCVDTYYALSCDWDNKITSP